MTLWQDPAVGGSRGRRLVPRNAMWRVPQPPPTARGWLIAGVVHAPLVRWCHAVVVHRRLCRSQGGGRPFGAYRTRLGGADPRALHRMVAEDRGLLRPEGRHEPGDVLRGRRPQRRHRAERHARPRLVGPPGQPDLPARQRAGRGVAGAPRDAPRPASARIAPEQEVRRGLPPRLDRVWRDSTLRVDPANPAGR